MCANKLQHVACHMSHVTCQKDGWKSERKKKKKETKKKEKEIKKKKGNEMKKVTEFWRRTPFDKSGKTSRGTRRYDTGWEMAFVG